MKGKDNNTALIDAATTGNVDILQSLLEHSVSTVHCSKALRCAAEHGHAECVRLLIGVSDPKAQRSQALRDAVKHGHIECVKLLIPVSDPKANNSEALRLAAQYGNKECMRLLIGVSDAGANNSEALTYALIRRESDIVNMLWRGSQPRKVLSLLKQQYPHIPKMWQHIQDRIETEHSQNLARKLRTSISKKANKTSMGRGRKM